MKVKEKDYEVVYDCIVSEQVPPDMIAKYFEDEIIFVICFNLVIF